MRKSTTHTLVKKLNLRRTGYLLGVALVVFVLASGGTALANTSGGYTLTRAVISAGGGELTGESYTLAGTLGQPDAGVLTGSNYTLAGGFWSGVGNPLHLYLPLVVRN